MGARASGDERLTWLDALRLIAGLSMVGLHASSDAAGQPFPDHPAAERVAPVLFRAVVYTARTELFLLISIFLLVMALDRRPRGYGRMLAEQARRLLLPFAFWVLVFAVFRLLKAQHFGYAAAVMAELADPRAWLGYFLLGDVIFHMHFLPTLFGLVLMTPLYVIAARHPWSGLIVLVCLFAKREADLWMWSHLQGWAGFDYLLRTVKIVTYGGYGMAAGAMYGLYRSGAWERVTRGTLPVMAFAALMLFGVKLVHAARIIEQADWQFNFTPAYWADFLMPVVLFAVLMTAGSRVWPGWVSRLSPYSFGLYLCHPLFLGQFEILVDGTVAAPWAQVAIKFVGTAIVTLGFVWLLARIRLLAWTVGMGPLPRLPFPTPATSR